MEKVCAQHGGKPLEVNAKNFKARTDYRYVEPRTYYSRICTVCYNANQRVRNAERRAREKAERENPVRDPAMQAFLYAPQSR